MDKNSLDKDFRKANDQLFIIDSRKSVIKKEIYGIYNLYLKNIRFKLCNYINEAILNLIDFSCNGNNIQDKNISLLTKNELNTLVNKILPFLTIEQLSIKRNIEREYTIMSNSEFNNNYNLEDKIYLNSDIESLSKSDSIYYCNDYYRKVINKDLDLDNYYLAKASEENDFINNNLEFINSLISFNVDHEEQDNIKVNLNKYNKNFIPIEFKEILDWLDKLNSSLNYYLKELSIEINNALFNKNILKTFLNKDLLNYIFENNLLFNNPSPFILLFDISLNQFINIEKNIDEDKYPRIYLINIDSTELEYSDINLSILKNKINDLRFNINLLIKKENYWSNKIKINLRSSSYIEKT